MMFVADWRTGVLAAGNLALLAYAIGAAGQAAAQTSGGRNSAPYIVPAQGGDVAVISPAAPLSGAGHAAGAAAYFQRERADGAARAANAQAEPIPGATATIPAAAEDGVAVIAPALPPSGLARGSSVAEYFQAARTAMAGGHVRQAQQALEMAETRELGRSMPPGAFEQRVESPIVLRIAQARRALALGDLRTAAQLIDIMPPTQAPAVRP